MPNATPGVDPLDQIIYQTVRYFDIIHLPVTATMLWRSLVSLGKPLQKRRLAEITERLQQSAWLRDQIGSHWGYFYLKGREKTVVERLERHRIAQKKWKSVRRIARWLSWMPFVRMIAVTGSLGFSNTTHESDLDFFIVSQHNHIWTTRLFLLLASELTGRRRRYSDRIAPDKICLNHYVTDTALRIASDNRNIYNAVTYTYMVPLVGVPWYERFRTENAAWMQQWVTTPEMLSLPPVQALSNVRIITSLQRVLEILLGLFGTSAETVARSIQQAVVQRHQEPTRAGRVVLNNQELAFHPDSKADTVATAFFVNKKS